MNKRQLKKEIQGLCGGMACDCVLASDAMPTIDEEKVNDMVVRAARAQARAMKQISVAFDKAPRDFSSRKEYNRARRSYYKAAMRAMGSELGAEMEAIVKEMNAMLTPEQREANKAAAKA